MATRRLDPHLVRDSWILSRYQVREHRAVWRIEPIGKCQRHGRVIHDSGGDLEIAVFDDGVAEAKLMGAHQRSWVYPFLVTHPSIDIRRAHLEERVRDAREWRRPPRVHRCRKPRGGIQRRHSPVARITLLACRRYPR